MKKVIFSPLIILLLLCSFAAIHARDNGLNDTSIRIIITFNNSVSNKNLKDGPGFSAWIEYNGKAILFDTGSNYPQLLENIDKLGLDIKKLNCIFISHNHWDHVFGLPGIAGALGYSIDVYFPEFSADYIIQQIPQLKLNSIREVKELYPKIWTSGELRSKFLKTIIAEQVLILEQKDGLVVIVGCSHPGFEEIVKCVKERFRGKDIKLIAGGFHLNGLSIEEIKRISESLKQSGVKKIAPSHCTGNSAIEFLKKDWGPNFIQLFLGDEYILE